jgi:hypothetical protein
MRFLAPLRLLPVYVFGLVARNDNFFRVTMGLEMRGGCDAGLELEMRDGCDAGLELEMRGGCDAGIEAAHRSCVET